VFTGGLVKPGQNHELPVPKCGTLRRRPARSKWVIRVHNPKVVGSNPALVLFPDDGQFLVTLGITAEFTLAQGYPNSVGSAFGFQIGFGAGDTDF